MGLREWRNSVLYIHPFRDSSVSPLPLLSCEVSRLFYRLASAGEGWCCRYFGHGFHYCPNAVVGEGSISISLGLVFSRSMLWAGRWRALCNGKCKLKVIICFCTDTIFLWSKHGLSTPRLLSKTFLLPQQSSQSRGHSFLWGLCLMNL